jgi:RNA polymerase sigma-70 factor (ECF subfamily)
MAEPTPFPELLVRLRRGEEDAVREFIGAYEPFIRRSLRRRMARGRRFAVADSDDLCQSVLAGFLVRAAAGEYDLAEASDLERLLVGMIRNKVAALARREAHRQGDRVRFRLLESGEDPAGDSGEDPARVVAARDLLAQVRERLAPQERILLDHRQAGRSWDEVAAVVGESAAVLRKRLSRALRAVAVELGLETPDEQ